MTTPDPTRRRFLKRAVTGAAVAGLGPAARAVFAQLPAGAASPHVADSRGTSRVVETRSDHVVANGRIREDVLDEMMTAGLLSLTATDSRPAAWQALLGPVREATIGLRFERLGEPLLRTAAPLARWLVIGLVEAGWPAGRILLMNPPPGVDVELGVRRFDVAWSPREVDFGSGSDHLSAFVEQADLIINVPFLKDDNITGLSGCLKGATYHFLKHPARYHDAGGAPVLGDVLALPVLAERLRLHVLNALRIVCHRGPLVYNEHIADSGAVVLSRDPLAADTVGLEILNQARRERGLPAIALDEHGVPTLVDAARRGLGHVDRHRIERRLVVIP